MALLLAAIGLYGTMALTVSQRTRELGIRIALGAQRSTVLGDVLRRGMMITVLGAGMGLLLSFALTPVLDAYVDDSFGPIVGRPDTMILAACVLVLATVALAACWHPAQRATRVDPMVALRHE